VLVRLAISVELTTLLFAFVLRPSLLPPPLPTFFPSFPSLIMSPITAGGKKESGYARVLGSGASGE
jgi:hypothetical protein